MVTRLYCATRQDLRTAIRFLEEVKLDFAKNRVLRPSWKEGLDSGFGAQFYDQLTKWMPMSCDAVAMAVHLDRHAQTFRLPLPDLPKTDRVVIDPEQGAQMVAKLLDIKLQDLRDLSTILQQKAIEGNSTPFAVNFDFRHFASAARQLRSAVRWFFELKEKGR
jgi:hypothetical protein